MIQSAGGLLSTASSVCLKETCRKLHALIDKVDEARYDLQAKVTKAEKEVNLNNEAPACSVEHFSHADESSAVLLT